MVSPPSNGAIMLRGSSMLAGSKLLPALFEGSFPELRALKAPDQAAPLQPHGVLQGRPVGLFPPGFSPFPCTSSSQLLVIKATDLTAGAQGPQIISRISGVASNERMRGS